MEEVEYEKKAKIVDLYIIMRVLHVHVFDLELSKEMLPSKLQNAIHEQKIHTATTRIKK